jgi:hypothetical protein
MERSVSQAMSNDTTRGPHGPGAPNPAIAAATGETRATI